MPRKKSTLAQRKKRQDEFLAEFPAYGTVTHTARAVGIGRRTHYNWLEEDPEYAEAFRSAEEESTDELEQVAIRRAKESSDTLLIFLLKGRKPEMYRERRGIELTGKAGGPIETKDSTVDLSKLSTETLRTVLEELGDED